MEALHRRTTRASSATKHVRLRWLVLVAAFMAVAFILGPVSAGTAKAQQAVDIGIDCSATVVPGDTYACTYSVTNQTRLGLFPAPLVGPVVINVGLGGVPHYVYDVPSWPPSGSIDGIGGGGTTFILGSGLGASERVDIEVMYFIDPAAHYQAGPGNLVANISVYQTEDLGAGVLLSALVASEIDVNADWAPEANLTIDLDNLFKSAAPGATILYEASICNTGPSDVAGIGLDFTAGANLDATTVDLSPNDNDIYIPADQCRSVLIAVQVDANAPPNGTVEATATVNTGGVDWGSAPAGTVNAPADTSTVTSFVVVEDQPSADLSITNWSCTSVKPGVQFGNTDTVCTVTFANNGSNAAHDVTLAHRLRLLVPQNQSIWSNDVSTTQTDIDTNRLWNCSNGFNCTRREPMPPGVQDTVSFRFRTSADAHLDSFRDGRQARAEIWLVAANPDPNTVNNFRGIELQVEPTVNLRIEKTLLTPAVAPGGSALFDVTIYNDGPADVDGIRIADNIIAGPGAVTEITPREADADGGDGLYIAAKESVRILVVVDLNPGALPGDIITNEAVVNTELVDSGLSTLGTATGYNGNINGPLSDDADLTLGPVVPTTDIGVANFGADWNCTAIKPGLNADTTCTVVVENLGDEIAYDATVDLFLRNVVAQAMSVDVTASTDPNAPGQLTRLWNCSNGFHCERSQEMPPGAQDTLLFRFRALPDAHLNNHPGRNIQARMRIGMLNPDSNLTNNQRQQNLDVEPGATVRIEKKLLTPDVAPGGTALFQVTLYNDGPADIDGIRIEDQITAGPGAIVAVTPADADALGGGLYIRAGGNAAILVAVDVDPGALPGDVITNEAKVNIGALDAGLSTLGTPSGYIGNLNFPDTVVATVDLTVGQYLPDADIDVTSTIVDVAPPAGSPAIAGQEYTFEMYVRNSGPAMAEGVTAHNLITNIPGWALINITPGAGWTCDGGINCTRQSPMAPNPAPAAEELVATVTIRVPANADPTVDVAHLLAATADNPDPNFVNNTASFAKDVQAQANLSIEKIALESEIVAGGDSILFKINITNNGPSDAYDVEVVDLPGDLTLVSVSSSNVPMNCLGDDCKIPVLPAGVTAIIDVVIKADPDLQPSIVVGPYENQALIQTCKDDGIDYLCTYPEGPVSAEVDVVGFADLKLQKFVKPDGIVAAGVPFVFTIFVDNLGVSAATNVTVEDTLFSDGDFQVLNISADAGTCDPPPGGPVNRFTFTCELTALARYDRWTIDVQVVAVDDVDVNNEARVMADDPQDPDMSNNADTAAMSVTGSADLSVAKEAVTSPIKPGEMAAWTITVKNDGPSAATNVQISDILPGGILEDTIEVTGAACTAGTPGSPADPTVCNLANMSNGDSVALTIKGQLDPNYVGAPGILNDVRVGSDTGDPNQGNNRATSAIAVNSTGALTVFKQSKPSTVNAGERVDYVIDVSVGTPPTAVNVVMSDTLPVEFQFISAGVVGSGGAECTHAAASRLLTCVLGDMQPDTHKQIVVQGTIAPDTPSSTIRNTAAVTADNAAPQRWTATTEVRNEANLRVTKRSSSLSPATGDVFFYTVEIANDGPSDARDVKVVDELTGSVEYLYSRGAQCTNADEVNNGDDVVTCMFDRLPAGETLRFDIVVQVNDWVWDGHRSDNVVEVTSATPPHDEKPVYGYSEEIVFRNVHDLKIRKFGKPDGTVEAGEELTYTLLVDNFGPGVAYHVRVTDLLASNGIYSFESSQCQPAIGTNVSGNQQLTCNRDRLDPGHQWTIKLTVKANEPQTINNVADVQAEGTDRDTGNNSAIVEHAIDAAVNLDVTKSVDHTTVNAGGQLVYRVTVRNLGPSVATNVRVMDTLPAGVTLASISTTWGNCVPADVACVLSTLAPSQVAEITIQAHVEANLPSGAMLFNTVRVIADEFDVQASNNVASAVTRVTRDEDLRVTKEVSAATIGAGEILDYKITVENLGASAVDNVVIKDNLPHDVNFVSYQLSPNVGACIDSLLDPEVICDLGTLGQGETHIIVIRVQVDPNAAEGIIVNQVMSDPRFSGDSRLETSTVVVRGAHMRIEMSTSIISVAYNEVFSYKVKVLNNGVATLRDVRVDVNLPNMLQYVMDTVGCGQSLRQCALGEIPPGESREFEVLVKLVNNVVNGTWITTSATASTSSAEPGSNSATTSTTIVADTSFEGDRSVFLPLITR